MIGFIVNRRSGNGQGAIRWKETERLLIERGVKYGVKFTEYGGHARELAKELAALPETTAVVALGGDGTVNEVSGGLAGGRIPMGCIPSGSGNDYARSVGIPNDLPSALDRILSRKAQVLDAGKLNGQPFVISAGIGFDGEVARMTNAAPYKRWLNKLRLGSLAYVISVLRLLANYRPSPIELELDGKAYSFHSVWLVAVANLPYYGGGMKICPDARADDGLFQLCLVEGITRWELLLFFPRVFRGTHTSHPAIHLYTASHVKIRGEKPLAIHVDGEWAGTTPAQITVQAGSLPIL